MITHDIQRFSTHLAAIYSNLAKPILDVILYNYQLSQNVGMEGIMGLTFFVQLSAELCESIHEDILRELSTPQYVI
jgi:ATP-binding cassette subfamily D (ALD) long-chain fatty acid import protein